MAAPGDAGRPMVSRSLFAFGSSVGCNNWSNDKGSMRNRASSLEICPDNAISTAILNAAFAVLLPERV